MELAYYCMDNPKHIFKGKNLDGVRCPYCDGMVNVKPVSKEEYEKLPMYLELKKPKSKSKGLSINIGFDDKTILKLRAIAKHAGALADELEAIDNPITCEECGSEDVEVDSFYVEDTPYFRCVSCSVCGHQKNLNADELPTRLEGSD